MSERERIQIRNRYEGFRIVHAVEARTRPPIDELILADLDQGLATTRQLADTKRSLGLQSTFFIDAFGFP